MTTTVKLDWAERLAALDPAPWDALVGPHGAPFFEHAFLAATERTGCVGPGTGWTPRPLLLRAQGAPVAAAAAWIKHHSDAEFVYDWAWAEAAARAGLPYYPKLVVAAPFSPVGGPRMLLGAERDAARRRHLQRTLAQGAVALARDWGLSGVHWLFVTEDEAAVLAEVGYEIRHTVQYHWHAEGDGDFDAFLARFPSKRRHQIRRERAAVRAAGVTTRVLAGDALDPALAPLLHALYAVTVDKFPWGRRYLTEALFADLLTHWRRNLMVVLAERDGEVVGGAINAAKDAVLYGRYWGALADVPFLHFEVCSYAGIEYCLAHGFRRFEAGAGGGEHKHGRGFRPTVTRSAHWLFHPGLDRAVRGFVQAERAALARRLAAGAKPTDA